MTQTIKTAAASVFMSSQDATRLSLTVKGLLLQLVPVIIMLAQAYGISTIGESDVVAIIEGLSQIAAMAISLVGLVMTVWGLVRKLFNPAAFNDLYTPEELEK